MRVAFLTLASSMHINIKAKYFQKSSDRVYFFGMKFKYAHKDIDISVEYRENMEVTLMGHDSGNLKSILDNTWKMYQIIRKNKIEVVHIIDMNYAVYAITLRLLGVKVVIENNGSDVILAPKDKHTRSCYKWAYKLCNAVVQDSAVAQAAGIALGASEENNEVIELGIDTNIFNLNIPSGVFREKYGIPKDAKVIFSPRSFRPLDNIKEIIDTIEPVMKEFPNTYFVFCSYQKNWKYQNLIEKATKQVIYLGYVDNEKEMPYIYRDSDIVLSIPNSDSSPRTVYEAIACGCNVIVSELPWIGKKFTNGRELFVVKLHDKGSLIELMCDILGGRKVIDHKIAFARVKEILDYRISERKLRQLYKRIR